MLLTRLILIAVAASLAAVAAVLVYKYRKLTGRKDVVMTKEDVIGRMFLKKLRNLEGSLGKEDPGALFRKLNRIMKSFFRELFDINYEFDYLELNEEMTKMGTDKGIRDQVIPFTMRLSQAEYSGMEITGSTVHDLVDSSMGIVSAVTGLKGEMLAGKVPMEKPAEEPAGIPVKVEKAAKLSMPAGEKDSIERLRHLLTDAEADVRRDRAEDALESYSELREIYESLPKKVRMSIYPEAKRIIAIYNALLKEYKDILVGKKGG